MRAPIWHYRILFFDGRIDPEWIFLIRRLSCATELPFDHWAAYLAWRATVGASDPILDDTTSIQPELTDPRTWSSSKRGPVVRLVGQWFIVTRSSREPFEWCQLEVQNYYIMCLLWYMFSFSEVGFFLSKTPIEPIMFCSFVPRVFTDNNLWNSNWNFENKRSAWLGNLNNKIYPLIGFIGSYYSLVDALVYPLPFRSTYKLFSTFK